MAEVPHHRHRLGVLPGLASTTTNTPINLPDEKNTKQLVAISPPVLPEIGKKRLSPFNGTHFEQRSPINDQTYVSSSQVHNVTSRLSAVEEANRALLEEIYRLQSYIRTVQHEKKEGQHNEKKLHHDVMQSIRASNEIISELTQRLRTMEDKLHIEKENRKSLSSLSKRLEQTMIASQQEVQSHEDKQISKVTELRNRVEEITRNLQRSERTSQSIVEEFHQLKSKFDMQALEFTHMQSEVRQRTKRQEDETKEALMQARYQKDSNSLSEQSLLQMRQFFESRLSELRDSLNEVRARASQAEADYRSMEQQSNMKMGELQNQLGEQFRNRQEELQALNRSRQEKDHTEESERNKLTLKIQAAVEDMSEKLLQKEVRLREEALRKFVDLERQLQNEQSQRMDYEKLMRDDNDKRWNMQQTVLQEEMQAIKELHRSERNKNASSTRKIEDEVHSLTKTIAGNKKSLEKVLVAEITKRESQGKNVNTQIESLQEQLRVALSSLQQAIGGLQFQVARDKESFTNEVKEKMGDEAQKINRGLSDVDARITSLSVRLTQQDESLESRVTEMASELRKEQREALHNTDEWRENLTKDLNSMHEKLQDFPQEVKEMQERFNSLKEDVDSRTKMEAEARLKDADSMSFKVRALMARMESVEVSEKEDHKKINTVEQSLTTIQNSSAQMDRLMNDVRTNLNVRLNSETKMRLEETSEIKRELARLKLDVQPLLWRQTITNRKFVKKESISLNEWYDMKMRWMRLLSRSKRKKRTQRQNAESSESNPNNQIDLRSGAVHETPTDGVPVSNPMEDSSPQSASHPPTPEEQKPWYNQDNVGLPLEEPERRSAGRNSVQSEEEDLHPTASPEVSAEHENQVPHSSAGTPLHEREPIPPEPREGRSGSNESLKRSGTGNSQSKLRRTPQTGTPFNGQGERKLI